MILPEAYAFLQHDGESRTAAHPIVESSKIKNVTMKFKDMTLQIEASLKADVTLQNKSLASSNA
jgi:hypothetical protein